MRVAVEPEKRICQSNAKTCFDGKHLRLDVRNIFYIFGAEIIRFAPFEKTVSDRRERAGCQHYERLVFEIRNIERPVNSRGLCAE